MNTDASTKLSATSWVAIIGFPVLIAAAVLFVWWQSGSKTRAVISDGKGSISAKLKDPSSAQFQNLHVRLATLCGEVNAKNSFGAYTGFEPFRSGKGFATLRSDIEGLSPDALLEWDQDYERCLSEGDKIGD